MYFLYYIGIQSKKSTVLITTAYSKIDNPVNPVILSKKCR